MLRYYREDAAEGKVTKLEKGADWCGVVRTMIKGRRGTVRSRKRCSIPPTLRLRNSVRCCRVNRTVVAGDR